VIISKQPGIKERGKSEMQATAPLKEVTDIIKEAGGEELKLCYQCGLCTGVCPWNIVRSFLVRRIMYQAQLGLVDFRLPLCYAA